MNPAVLALEDGTVFEGISFGAPVERTGEVVFNTAITGYQEIFTDPSYSGQIVVLTNPQIGNYGANAEDNEAAKPYIEGLAVREFSPLASNWRADETAQQFLTTNQVPVIAGIDTRALVRHLRSRGVMRGVLSATCFDRRDAGRAGAIFAVDDRARSGHARVDAVALRMGAGSRSVLAIRSGARSADRRGFTSSAYDFGIKHNILRRLVQVGCRLTVVPAGTTAEDVLALKPDGVFLSNGPGDPEPLDFQAAQIRKLIGRVPIFGICLGHQILGLAMGAKTYKLKFGHRGANHPVINKLTGKVEITSHNHGFAVDPDSLNLNEIEITHMNLNDDTLEGFRHRTHPVFCVQYHPEAAPGPHDSRYLFDDFVKLMETHAPAK